MPDILCTFPGKYGDILWALLTVRALAVAADHPVDLAVSPKYGASGFLDLLRHQPYLGTVDVCADWTIHEQGVAPMSPWSPFDDTLHHQAWPDPSGYDRIVHLGYRGWPDRPLPQYVYAQTQREYPDLPLADLTLDLPWVLAVPPVPPIEARPRTVLAVGFSDDWFELKYGVTHLLHRHPDFAPIVVGSSPRWRTEAGGSGCSWPVAAQYIQAADLFVGCNSGLHVLACAVRTPVVMLEPAEGRHNPIFFPYGDRGPQVTLVRGGDGKPTFDARHLADTIRQRVAAGVAR